MAKLEEDVCDEGIYKYPGAGKEIGVFENAFICYGLMAMYLYYIFKSAS